MSQTLPNVPSWDNIPQLRPLEKSQVCSPTQLYIRIPEGLGKGNDALLPTFMGVRLIRVGPGHQGWISFFKFPGDSHDQVRSRPTEAKR